MTKPETIIITSDEPFSGSWHTQIIYARYLSGEYLVIFMDPPEKWQPRNLFSQPPSPRKISETLWVIPYHNRFPAMFSQLNELLNAHRLFRHLRSMHARQILLWQFDSFRNALTSKSQYKNYSVKRIYHVSDPFHHNPIDRELARTADLIAVSAENNLKHYDAAKRIHLPQAIDVRLARELVNGPQDIAVSLSFAMILGTISDALDYDVIGTLAQSGIPIVFAGEKKGLRKHADTFESVLRYPNVEYVGALSPSQFYPLIAAANCGIVAYDEASGEGRAVLKFLHFLVARKPIISNVQCGDGTLDGRCVFPAHSGGEFFELCKSAEYGTLSFDSKKAEDYLDTADIRHAIDYVFKKLYR